jgi:hypothetical protein
MTKNTAAATSPNFKSDRHFSTNTFRTGDILSKTLAERQLLLSTLIFFS